MLFHFEKDSNNYPNSTFLWHASLIFTNIMHMVKANSNKKKYPKYYSNQISKHFDDQKRVFKGVVFCTLPLRDFITLKSPGLIGLSLVKSGKLYHKFPFPPFFGSCYLKMLLVKSWDNMDPFWTIWFTFIKVTREFLSSHLFSSEFFFTECCMRHFS